MVNRSPIAVLIYSIITCGIYYMVWSVKTKDEMVSLGADIPTAWLLIVPFANLFWIWKYSEGIEKVTGAKTSAVLALVLLLLLGPIGAMVLQGKFNEIAKA
jgi:ABC-type transport system involved in cytochrome c biogenesis permease subunit